MNRFAPAFSLQISFNIWSHSLLAFVGLALAGTQTFSSATSRSTSVEIQMREVNLHLDQSTVLEVRRLRGQMVPTRADQPVTFDDPTSFKTRVSSAEIAIAATTLSGLLNQRVFNYPGAPLKNIEIKTENGQIKQTGTMHKGVDLPFEVEGPIDATPDGEIRLHAHKVISAHVPVKGLLHLFGEDLSKLVNLRKDRGVRVEGDDILIRPSRLLPPPEIDGKVGAVRVESDRIVLIFNLMLQVNSTLPTRPTAISITGVVCSGSES